MTIVLNALTQPPARSTVLQNVQEFCRRTGLGVPLTVTGNVNPQVQQYLGLLNEELDECTSDGFEWQEMRGECVFLTTPGEDQGTIDGLAGTAVNYIVNDTLWNRGTRLQLWGAVNAQGWQAIQALTPAMPNFGFRVMNNKLFLTPGVDQQTTISFEYHRKFAVNSGGNPEDAKLRFTDDVDTCVFTDEHMISALRWRWKREKGLVYAEDKARYDAIIAVKKIHNQPRNVLSLYNKWRRGPAIFVPAGNWITPGS